MKEQNPSILHTKWHYNSIVLLLVAFLCIWGLTWCEYLMNNWKWLKILSSSWLLPKKPRLFWKPETILKCHIFIVIPNPDDPFFKILALVTPCFPFVQPLYPQASCYCLLSEQISISPLPGVPTLIFPPLSVSAIQNYIFLPHKQFLTSSFFFPVICVAAVSYATIKTHPHLAL